MSGCRVLQAAASVGFCIPCGPQTPSQHPNPQSDAAPKRFNLHMSRGPPGTPNHESNAAGKSSNHVKPFKATIASRLLPQHPTPPQDPAAVQHGRGGVMGWVLKLYNVPQVPSDPSTPIPRVTHHEKRSNLHASRAASDPFDNNPNHRTDQTFQPASAILQTSRPTQGQTFTCHCLSTSSTTAQTPQQHGIKDQTLLPCPLPSLPFCRAQDVRRL